MRERHGAAGRLPRADAAAASAPPLRVPATGPVEQPETTPWTHAARVADGTLDLHYLEGSSECGVLAEVRVEETVDAVTVTLASGRPAGDRDTCGLVGYSARTRITLRAPLGARRLLDGSTTPPATRELR